MLTFLLLIRIVLAAVFISEDQLCDPGGKNVSPYTGFRVYRRYSYGWPVLHNWHMVYCKRGFVEHSAHFLASRNSNFLWNQTLCLASDKCYQFARRKKYSEREVPVFISNVQLGGIFVDNGTPLLPVLAAPSNHEFQFRERGRLIKYVPLLYTPDLTNVQYPHRVDPSGIPKWAHGLDWQERYEFTEKDRKTVWWQANKIINRASDLMTIDDHYLPWEFDHASYELSRQRFRDRWRRRWRGKGGESA